MFDSQGASHTEIACRQLVEQLPDELLNLEGLRNRCMGNIQLVERILNKFQQRMPEELEELEKALELSDTEQIARIAHRVKGTSASVSASTLQQAATEIEDLSRAGRITEIPVRIEQLRGEWDRCNRVVCDVISGAEQKCF
ncbi:MAG: Hpt domain-containing protein [Pirellulales bacterium]|nr:Hpt domain-containing protein [Pirellulales bacterium]